MFVSPKYSIYDCTNGYMSYGWSCDKYTVACTM